MSAQAIISQEAHLIQSEFGVTFAASFVAAILFGIVIAQLYVYVKHFSTRDVVWLKLFVFFIFFCDLLSTIFTIWWMYYLFVSNWGNAEVFAVGNWLIAMDPFILGIMGCANHLFFARRVKILTQNIWLALTVCFFGIATLAGALAGTVQFMSLKDFADISMLRPAGITWLLSAALGDTTITVSLIWYLRSKRSGFSRTDQILDKIIRVTVTNGLLTATVAMLDLIVFLASPKPFHIAVSLIMPRIYTNTMLSSLNSREIQPRESSGHKSTSTGSIMMQHTTKAPHRPEVRIQVESHELVDMVKSDSDWASKGDDIAV